MHSSDTLLRSQCSPELRVRVVGLRGRHDHDRPCPPSGILVGLADARGFHVHEHKHACHPGPAETAVQGQPGRPNRLPIVHRRTETTRTVASRAPKTRPGARSPPLATRRPDSGSGTARCGGSSPSSCTHWPFGPVVRSLGLWGDYVSACIERTPPVVESLRR